MNDSMWMRWLGFIVLPLIVLIFYINVVSHFDYTPDDTYIYLQFARNVVDGNSFAFNPGEPTYGVTSPLWTYIISLSGYFGTDYLLTAKVFDIIFASIAIIVFFLFTYRILGDYLVAILAAVTFSVNAWLIRWSGTGMETSLAVLLTLFTLYHCWKHEYYLAGFFAGFLFLTRPESIIMLPLILLDIYLNTYEWKRAFKKIIIVGITFSIITVPWLIYARLKFGSIIPNTAFAKASLGFVWDDFMWTTADLFKTLFVTEAVTFSIVVIGIIILIFLIIKKSKSDMNVRTNSALLWIRGHCVPLLWIFGVMMAYILTQTNVVSRYLLLIIPIIIIYFYVFMISIFELLGKSKYFYPVLILLTVIIMLQNQIIYRNYVQPSIQAFSTGMKECFIPIGRWLNQNTSDNAVIFVPDIGAIGYYSQRKVCDAAGLVSPELLTYLRRGVSYEDIMKLQIYKKVCKPDFVVHRADKPNPLTDKDLVPIFYKSVCGLGLSNMKTVYYSVYRVIKN